MKRNNVAFTLENGERKMIQCSDCGIECKSIEMETVSNDDQLIAVLWSNESCLSKLDPATCEIVWRTTRRTDARVI